MAPKPTQIEAGPTLLEVKSPIPGNMEKALRRVMPQPMADFVFGAVVYELQAGDAPKKKPPERGHTYGGGENVTRAYASPMEDTYPDDEFGYDTIDLMLKTGTVRFALELKKAAVLSALFNELQWQIECEDEKLREIVTADMKRVFATYGAEMLSMLEYGAFFGELVWEYAPATMRGLESKDKWWVLEGINTVKPETVDHINRVREGKNMGRFDGFVQKANLPWPKHTVSVDQALILTFRKKWRNLWGESILKAAYPLWYWFDIILAAFIRYLGRSGIPLTVCTAPMKGRMKMSDGTWMSTMDYGLLVATEATRSEAVALPSDRNPETGEPLFTLGYLTDDKRGDQFIGALKFVSDLLTRAIIMGAMADMSKEGGGFNREEARFGMTQLDNQQILSMMISQLARYHLPKYATYNASPGTYIDMLLVGLDPSRIDRVFKFLSTAGNQKEGDALNWPDWELIFQLSGVPTLTKEEVDRLKKEREQKALEMQKMMKEKKAEEEGPPQEGKEKEGEEKKEELEEALWEVLVHGSPIFLSTNQLDGIARNNPDLFQEQTTITLTRGQGRGQGGPPQGEGGPEKCVCPECGATVDHAPGKPCTERHCPKCGALMRGDLEEKLIDALRSGNVVLYNPYHDEKGRFASREHAVTGAGIRSEGRGKKKVRGKGRGPIGEPKSDLMPHEFKYSIKTHKIVNRKKFEGKVNKQGGELAKRLPGCDNPPIIKTQDANFAYAGAHTDGTILLPLQTVSRITREKDGGFGHHALLHERVHARTRTGQRYGPGSWEEEGTTELLTRKIYRDIYGSDSPSNAYNRYVGRVGRAAWQASDGDAEKAWKYVDDAHNGKIEIQMPTDGQGWEAMLGARYKFEEAEDLMGQLLDLIEQKKWEEAKAFISEHPEDSLILVFGEAWIQEFGI